MIDNQVLLNLCHELLIAAESGGAIAYQSCPWKRLVPMAERLEKIINDRIDTHVDALSVKGSGEQIVYDDSEFNRDYREAVDNENDRQAWRDEQGRLLMWMDKAGVLHVRGLNFYSLSEQESAQRVADAALENSAGEERRTESKEVLLKSSVVRRLDGVNWWLDLQAFQNVLRIRLATKTNTDSSRINEVFLSRREVVWLRTTIDNLLNSPALRA